MLVSLPLLARFLRSTRGVDPANDATTPWVLLGLGALGCVLVWALRPHFPELADSAHLLLLVGIGEELFFRGLVQSSLDQAWGTPWRILGTELGWGWIVQAILFGLAHPLLSSGAAPPASALWTAAAGLVFGWIRARSGTILAPALVHGVLDVVGLVLVPILMRGLA